jgi:hypothetical protein
MKKSDRKIVLRPEVIRHLSTSDLLLVRAGGDTAARPIAFDTERHNCRTLAATVKGTLNE